MNVLHGCITSNVVSSPISLVGIGPLQGHSSLSPNHVNVSDLGPGIPLVEQQEIFELLYRTPNQRNRYKGMEIGLALSKRLSEARDGTLSVHSLFACGSGWRSQVISAQRRRLPER